MRTAQNILITGATSGIGRHAAIHLAGLGHKVIASGRNEAALTTLQQEAARAGYWLETCLVELSDADSREALYQQVKTITNGYGLDVLVNNAGYGQMGPVETIPAEKVRAQFEINVICMLEITKLFIPEMRARHRGRIINLSSIGGRVTFPFGGVYHASKYAVEALSDALRMELNLFGIQVILVEPGPIATQFATTGLHSLEGVESSSDYDHILRHGETLQRLADRFAASPRSTSKTIEMAIRARWPRARYVSPWPNNLLIWLMKCLPPYFLDWCIKQALKPRN